MIRAAQSSDAKETAALWNWMIRDTLHTFTTEEKTVAGIGDLIQARPRHFFVSENQGKFGGFATFGTFRSGPGYRTTCEHSVLVDPDCHGLGIGRALMEALIHAAKTQNYRVMVAAISGENRQAVSFHTKLGFEQVGNMPHVGFKADRWLDLVLMQKNLTERA